LMVVVKMIAHELKYFTSCPDVLMKLVILNLMGYFDEHMFVEYFAHQKVRRWLVDYIVFSYFTYGTYKRTAIQHGMKYRDFSVVDYDRKKWRNCLRNRIRRRHRRNRSRQ
jgi:hypothetical protein